MIARRLFWMTCIIALCGWCPGGAAAEPKDGVAPPSAANSHAPTGGAPGDPHVPDIGHANASETLTDPSEWRADLAIYTFCVFVLLLAILWKFAWGPIAAGLERREKAIADNVAAAEEAAEEARRLTLQYDAKLAGAADEVRQLLDEARRDAEHTRLQIIEEARVAAGRERDRTLREIEAARQGALKDLADRATDLAISLAGRIAKTKLSPEEHARLVREAVSEFSAAGPSRN